VEISFGTEQKIEGGEETYERYDVRRVGNDWDSDLDEISLDLSDVALLLLTISEVLPLVSDRSASSGSSRRRDRSSLGGRRVSISCSREDESES